MKKNKKTQKLQFDKTDEKSFAKKNNATPVQLGVALCSLAFPETHWLVASLEDKRMT